MGTVAEIESAIENLPPADQRAVRDWILGRNGDTRPALQQLGTLIGSVSNVPNDLAENHDALTGDYHFEQAGFRALLK
jgi:hypothetical protein